jgi:hypothetical protein
MMPWAIAGIFVIFLLIAYIIVQGTRAALAWRKAAAEGDVRVIRDIVDDAIKVWSSQKRPKEVRVEVWRGVQSMQAIEVAPGYVHVSVSAESEYRQDAGRWVEISNPFQSGTEIAAKAVDMLLYELPHYRPDDVQVDVYAQYRDDSGATRYDCVVSVQASREQARAVDWDEWTPSQVISEFDSRYKLSDTGRPLPVEPLETPERYRLEEEPSPAEASA